jgi:4-hydroxybutyryl-CoA dehydratase/vinylacetyl-CoA-Delta-isomerase
MGLRTPRQYLDSLRDGRVVHYRGRRVTDVTEHEALGPVAHHHTSIDFRLAEDPAHRDLATCEAAGGGLMSRFFKLPASPDDLLKRRALIELQTRVGKGTVVLIKEIGSDCLFALTVVAPRVDAAAGTAYAERVAAYLDRCRREDLALAVAQTDVKGDRSLRPSEQPHPDYYVRIVERKRDGIVIRGAKAHTTNTPYANEVLVLPTRAMGESDAAYAVACAVPANAKGLVMIASPFGGGGGSPFHSPISARHHLVDTVTLFEDVFVPWERVFLAGEWRAAGEVANTFVQFHRFTAISYKAPLLDLLVGAADLIADYNGIRKASHVVEKMTRLIAYSETVQGLTEMAAIRCRTSENGVAIPDVTLTNIAKAHFAGNYHAAVRDLQDLAGGLLVTGPDEADLANPETGGKLRHYLGGRAGVDGEARLRAFNLIRDLTASEFGGYNEILNIHAEGSLQAQQITIARDYDLAPARRYAEEVAGLRP